jgi:hypothetical protein
MIPAYPLQWPAGWPRTPFGAQALGKFGTMKQRQGQGYDIRHSITLAGATARVLAELARMGIDRQDVVISTNILLRLDGLPRSGQRAPRDPGAAVYWETRKRERMVMAIDQYTKVEQNLAAIAATLEAMRAIERHGGAQILDRAFTGFTALPAPSGRRKWRDVLEVPAGWNVCLDDVKDRYRRLARQRHPDRANGSDEAMSELNVALMEAEKELG